MIRPNEVIDPISDCPIVEDRGSIIGAHINAQITETEQNNNRLLSYLVLAIYCGLALGGGFVVVKSLILLSRYIARRQWLHRSNSLLSQNVDVVTHRRALSQPSHTIFLLFGGLVLAGGFTYSAVKYSDALSYREKSANLKLEREQILDEQRRLMLSVEEEQAPRVLEQRAGAIGMRPRTKNDSLAKQPNRKETSGSVPEKVITEPQASNTGTIIEPLTLKIVLVILALLGGTLAAMFSFAPGSSELLAGPRLHSTVIGRAPGANYLLIVDFLFSPKTVEETFKPIVADWRTEYFEALNQRRKWKARWISVRYTYSFVASMGLTKIVSFIKIFTRAGG